jgi:hypothetical protein
LFVLFSTQYFQRIHSSYPTPDLDASVSVGHS